jgi:hypothetical protein
MDSIKLNQQHQEEYQFVETRERDLPQSLPLEAWRRQEDERNLNEEQL